MRGDGWQLSGLRRRFWTGAHRALCERPAAVRELVRPRPAVRALEQTALVAQLEGVSQSGRAETDTLTTLPGLRLDRLHVEVSVVPQL